MQNKAVEICTDVQNFKFSNRNICYTYDQKLENKEVIKCFSDKVIFNNRGIRHIYQCMCKDVGISFFLFLFGILYKQTVC